MKDKWTVYLVFKDCRHQTAHTSSALGDNSDFVYFFILKWTFATSYSDTNTTQYHTMLFWGNIPNFLSHDQWIMVNASKKNLENVQIDALDLLVLLYYYLYYCITNCITII